LILFNRRLYTPGPSIEDLWYALIRINKCEIQVYSSKEDVTISYVSVIKPGVSCEEN